MDPEEPHPTYALASDEWFEQARELSSGLPARPGVGFRLLFDTIDDDGTHRRWHQVVEDGRIVAWAAGDQDEPDLELRWQWADVRSLYRNELSGDDALAALRVVVPGGVEQAAPPLDIQDTPELDLLPTISDATLTIQYVFADGPFGPVSYWMSFDEGRSSGMAIGVADDPDVRVRITVQKMVKVRTGEITILEALEHGGRVEGDVGPLMLLAGLEESPELHAAELACGPAGAVLARMGEVTCTPEHHAAMAALARRTA
ncbi:MAG: hypothetical protein WKF43_03170 [Acidimicrobiales bacterium]